MYNINNYKVVIVFEYIHEISFRAKVCKKNKYIFLYIFMDISFTFSLYVLTAEMKW